MAEIGMYINVRHNGIGETERAIDKLANTADDAEKKAKKLGMTFDNYSKTLSGLQSVAKATGASQDSIAKANLKVSQTANMLVDANGKVIASLKRVSDTAQQAGIGTNDYFKRLDQMKRSAYTAGASQKELSDSYLTVTKSAYHLTNSNGEIVRSLSRVADGAKKAKLEADKLNQIKGMSSGLSKFSLSSPFGDFTRSSGLSGLNGEVKSYTSSLNEASNATTKLSNDNKSLGYSYNLLYTSVAGYLSLQTANKAIAMADTMTSLNNQIKLVTSSQQEANQVQSELLDISSRTYASIESTTKLYTRTARAMEKYGKTQKEVLGFTEAINNAMRVGGSSATEQASALLQLSQAIGSGRLQGDEFRSISESAPILLDYISQYMGVASSELKQLGAEGKITGDIIFNAMSNAGEGLKKMTEGLPVTFEQSLVGLKNSSLELADTLLNQTGIIQGLGTGVKFVADNLNTLLIPVAVVATAMLGKFTATQLSSAKAFLIQEASAIKASRGITTYTASTLASTSATTAMNLANKGFGAGMRGLAGAFGMLGGVGGLVATTVIGLGAYALTSNDSATQTSNLRKSVSELKDELKTLSETFNTLSNDQKKIKIGELVVDASEARKRSAEIREEITNLDRQLSKAKSSGNTDLVNNLRLQLNILRAELKVTNQVMNDSINVSRELNNQYSKDVIDKGASAEYTKILNDINKKTGEIGLTAKEIFDRNVDNLVKAKEITDAEGETLKTLNAQKSVLQGLADARSNAVKMIESINERFENLGKTSIEIEIQAIMDSDSLSIVEAIEAIGKLRTIGASGGSKSGGGGSRSDPFKDRQDSLSQELSKMQALNTEYAKYGDPSKYTSAKELTLEFNNQASSLYKISEAQKKILMNQAMQLDSAKQLNEIAVLGSDYDKQIDNLNFELSLTGKMSREIERLQFFRALDLKAKEISIGMSEENVKALQKEIDKIKELYDSYGKKKDVSENDYIGGMEDGLTSFIDNAGSARDAFKNATEGALNSMSSGLADFVATGKMNFRDLTSSILQDIAKIMTQWAIAQAVGGITEAFGFSSGGAVPEFSSGGYTGNGGKYEPKGVVHGGEYVLNKQATQRIGIKNLDQMNKGYANGGYVGSVKPSSNGGGQMIVNQSINIESGANIDENMIAQLTASMRNEMNDVAKRWSLRTVGDQQRNGGMLSAGI